MIDAEEKLHQRFVGVVVDYNALRIWSRQYAAQRIDLSLLQTAVVSQVREEFKTDSVEILSSWVVDSEVVGDDRLARQRIEEHADIVKSGFSLETLPIKKHSDSKAIQGAVDVSIACKILLIAGAFQEKSKVTDIFVFSSDSDFKPAIETVIQNSKVETIWVVARTGTVGKDYARWLEENERIKLMSWEKLYPDASVLDFSDKKLTSIDTVLNTLDQKRNLGGNLKLLLDRNKLQNKDIEKLAKYLVNEENFEKFSIEGLWLWRNYDLDDGCVDALCSILRCQPGLQQLHLSHTKIGFKGCKNLVDTAKSIGYGISSSKPALYVRLNDSKVNDSDIHSLWSRLSSEGAAVRIPASKHNAVQSPTVILEILGKEFIRDRPSSANKSRNAVNRNKKESRSK